MGLSKGVNSQLLGDLCNRVQVFHLSGDFI